MTQSLLTDIGILNAITSFLGAIICLWFMQAVATNFSGPGGKLRICHRIGYAIAAMVLGYNAYVSLEYADDPRGIDLITLIVFIVLIVISGLRHKMVSGTLSKYQLSKRI